jgi:hypothetical protein
MKPGTTIPIKSLTVYGVTQTFAAPPTITKLIYQGKAVVGYELNNHGIAVEGGEMYFPKEIIDKLNNQTKI